MKQISIFLIGTSLGINLSVIFGNEIIDYQIGLLTFFGGLLVGEYPKWSKKKIKKSIYLKDDEIKK